MYSVLPSLCTSAASGRGPVGSCDRCNGYTAWASDDGWLAWARPRFGGRWYFCAFSCVFGCVSKRDLVFTTIRAQVVVISCGGNAQALSWTPRSWRTLWECCQSTLVDGLRRRGPAGPPRLPAQLTCSCAAGGCSLLFDEEGTLRLRPPPVRVPGCSSRSRSKHEECCAWTTPAVVSRWSRSAGQRGRMAGRHSPSAATHQGLLERSALPMRLRGRVIGALSLPSEHSALPIAHEEICAARSAGGRCDDRDHGKPRARGREGVGSSAPGRAEQLRGDRAGQGERRPRVDNALISPGFVPSP